MVKYGLCICRLHVSSKICKIYSRRSLNKAQSTNPLRPPIPGPERTKKEKKKKKNGLDNLDGCWY